MNDLYYFIGVCEGVEYFMALGQIDKRSDYSNLFTEAVMDVLRANNRVECHTLVDRTRFIENWRR